MKVKDSNPKERRNGELTRSRKTEFDGCLCSRIWCEATRTRHRRTSNDVGQDQDDSADRDTKSDPMWKAAIPRLLSTTGFLNVRTLNGVVIL